uniref:Zinc finger protein n=1 Tax=Schizaphis graminum TaxID=13262 RepID=A0A2S2PEE5_SCHGA
MDGDQVQIENQTISSDTDNDDEKEDYDALSVELSSSDNYCTSYSEDGTTDEDNVLKYECEKCKIRFRFKIWYNRHLSTHDPSSFRCNYCPKVYKRKDTLGEHMSCHVGGRVFKCITCVKNFSDRRNLRTHEKLIHNSDPVKCPKCQNFYADNRQLRYHNLRMHTNKKPFRCECNASFAVPSMLSKHRTKMNHPRPK